MAPIATVTSPGRGDTDLLLARFATEMAARGYRVRGVVQINTGRGADHPCDMDVRVLPEGPVFRISQSLGAEARGCRLDPSALEEAVAAVEATMASADLLIINKFGKHEAEGRGFRPLIAEALGKGIPVVIGLNRLNQPAFEAFAGDLAESCAPQLGALSAWAAEALDDEKHAAAG